MTPFTRRTFLRKSLTLGLALGGSKTFIARAFNATGSSNEAVRLGVVGLGATKAVGGVGGRGHQLLNRLKEIPNARIAALCDVDPEFVDREARPLREQGQDVTTHRDLRRVLDDKSIDAVIIAMPNHWHALATVWACQAGKDVYVEKPFSHDIWEGQQMVAAARKYNRIVQVGTQNRSSALLHRTFDSLNSGELGAIRYAHALVYRARDGIGTVSAPTQIPPGLDYDLWCGPTVPWPLMRNQLHYEWHWFWDTGNGEMGNNGIHVIDICRWALRQDTTPPRAISIGGRFGFNDCAQTANTQIALFDYHPAPMICEVRNLSVAKSKSPMGKFRNQTSGIVIDCEGGYFAGDASGGALFDRGGKKIKDLPAEGEFEHLVAAHLSNFLAAVRSRKSSILAAEALKGHVSTSCCHMANVSYRLGTQTGPDAIAAAARETVELADSFERCREYLLENGVDLSRTPATLGPWVTFDPHQQRFIGQFAGAANRLSRRQYRRPYVVPKV